MVSGNPHKIPHEHHSIAGGVGTDVAPKVAQEGIISKIAGYISGATSKAVDLIGFSPLLAPMVAGLFSGIGKLEKVKGLGAIGRAGNSVSGRMNGFMDKTVSEAFGGGKTADKLGEMAASAAETIGDGVNRAASAVRIPDYVPKASQWNAIRHISRLHKTISKIPDNKYIPELRNAVEEMAKLAESKGGMSAVDFEPHRNAFVKLIEQNKSVLDKKEIRVFNKILDSVGKAANSHKNASIWTNLGNTVKALPSAIGKTKVLPGLANVTFIGLSIASLVGVATNAIKNLSALKTMSKDITGKEVSTLDVIRGKVPDIIKEDRSKLLKNSVVSGATDAVSLGLNVASAVKGNVAFFGFMAPQFAGTALNAMIGESSLQVYTMLSQAHASGQKIPAEYYAELIGRASPELKARGGSSSIFAKKLGEVYAAENASPAQVMRAVNNGGMLKHMNMLIAANEGQKTASAATAGTTAGSHVAALQKTSHKVELKPVIGDHTAQLVANAGQAQHALNGV